MQIYDTQNRPIQLGREAGKGGEAVIYEVVGQPERLAKLYTGPPRAGYDQKLSWMLDYPPHDPTLDQGHASIAWPTELLYDNRQQLVGYLMPYIKNAVPLLEVFNPRMRARKLPGFDLRYLYRTARNLVITLAAIHAQSYVVGDINESNVLVTPTAMVTVIDTDSFQVQEKEGAKLVVYPCPVGKPEYTSPELQGRSFQHTVQKPEQDCFGLGVLIFQLLMDGSHPFRARWTQTGDPPPIEERIRQGCFPHVEQPSCPVVVPKTMLGLDTLYSKLAHLMGLCFVEGHQQPHRRPSPDLWEQALTEAEKLLQPCPQNHYYTSHLTDCPYCALKQQRQQAHRQRTVARQPQPTIRTRNVTQSANILSSKNLAMPIPAQTQPTLTHTQPKQVAMSVNQMIKCPNCGTSNSNTDIYCQKCVYQLCGNRWCIHCNHETPMLSSYCVHCGLPL